MNIELFHPAHLDLIELQDGQAHMSSFTAAPEYGAELAHAGPAFSVFVDGVLIACCGLALVWHGRAVAWAYLSKHAGPHMRPLHRAVNGFFMQYPCQRIESFIDADFTAARRWVELLGFKNETPGFPMRKYTPDGRDCYLYARIKDD